MMNANRLLCVTVLILLAATTPRIQAQTIWTGSHIVFTEQSNDPTDPANQDHITDNVWLTRGSQGPLFNAFSEPFFGNGSPAGTTWAVGALTNWASLQFQPWINVIGGVGVQPGPRAMV